MKIQHTPAPWTTGQASWNEDGDVQYTLHGIKSANAADCQLIEAAPELLAALKNSHNLLFGQWEVETHIVRREAMANQLSKNTSILAKARGEQ